MRERSEDPVSYTHLDVYKRQNKDNAIPRECTASLIYADAEEAKKAEELACSLAETLADEITPYEENFACEISSEEGRTAEAIPGEDARAFISAMYLAPNGVQSRNMKLDGFVVVSVNMGVVRSEENRLVIVFSPRSSVASLQEAVSYTHLLDFS